MQFNQALFDGVTWPSNSGLLESKTSNAKFLATPIKNFNATPESHRTEPPSFVSFVPLSHHYWPVISCRPTQSFLFPLLVFFISICRNTSFPFSLKDAPFLLGPLCSVVTTARAVTVYGQIRPAQTTGADPTNTAIVAVKTPPTHSKAELVPLPIPDPTPPLAYTLNLLRRLRGSVPHVGNLKNWDITLIMYL